MRVLLNLDAIRYCLKRPDFGGLPEEGMGVLAKGKRTVAAGPLPDFWSHSENVFRTPVRGTFMKRVFSSLLLCLVVSGCVLLPPPSTARLGDRLFVTTYPLTYKIFDTGQAVVVPIGFLTDLATIPRILWVYESPIDRSMAGAIVHDYLYWDQRCTQDEADAVFFLAMLESGVATHKAYEIYWAVNSPLGKSAYDKNAKARLAKEPRFLTEAYVRALQGSAADYKDDMQKVQAKARGAKAALFDSSANADLKQVCAAAVAVFKTKYFRTRPSDAEYAIAGARSAL